MNQTAKPKTAKGLVSDLTGLFGAWLRSLCGLDTWDAETAEILANGCQQAEKEARLRYGLDWRNEFIAYRLAARKRIWGVWHLILKPK